MQWKTCRSGWWTIRVRSCLKWAPPDQNVGYHYGAWAHAYLSYGASTDVLPGSFYKNLTDLDWEGASPQTYGKTSAQFIAEFDEFLQLPIEEQLEILP